MMQHKKAVAGLTVASLSAAGVAVVIRHRMGHKLSEHDKSVIDRIHSELQEAHQSSLPRYKQLAKVLSNLEQHGVGLTSSLIHHLVELRRGRLSDEAAIVVEYHLDKLNAQASQQDL